jgi:hypothetical protein
MSASCIPACPREHNLLTFSSVSGLLWHRTPPAIPQTWWDGERCFCQSTPNKQTSLHTKHDIHPQPQDVDLEKSFLCGYLKISGLTDEYPVLITVMQKTKQKTIHRENHNFVVLLHAEHLPFRSAHIGNASPGFGGAYNVTVDNRSSFAKSGCWHACGRRCGSSSIDRLLGRRI